MNGDDLNGNLTSFDDILWNSSRKTLQFDRQSIKFWEIWYEISHTVINILLKCSKFDPHCCKFGKEVQPDRRKFESKLQPKLLQV
jgi:hypothetical protein